MSLSSTLGSVRTTLPRPADSANPATAYSGLLIRARDLGLLRRTRVFYLSLLVSLGLAFAACVTGFVLLGDSWFQLIIAGAFGLLLTQFAFLGHEASHRQIFASGRANDRMGRIIATAVVGISYHWWMNKHTRHHTDPNTVGKDPDITTATIAFVPDDAASAGRLRKLFLRQQGNLFFPLLTLEGVNLHVQSIGHLFGRGRIEGRAFELAMIGLRIAVVVAAIFLVLPLGLAFAFLGVQLAVFGIYMGASFAPNHKGMPLVPEGTKVDFLRKQVLTSRNISGGFGMTLLMGGLNHQIEHHLFPNMPRPHLGRARKLVREHCAAEQIPYVETSLARSYAIVIRYLNQVGRVDRDPFDCPMVTAYGRL
jgi:fatty acid desaturase